LALLFLFFPFSLSLPDLGLVNAVALALQALNEPDQADSEPKAGSALY
jgi:hypothetical protein